METKTLTLPNYTITPLAQWLSVLTLSGLESRCRTRFINILSDRAQEIEKTRLELCEKHSAKTKIGDKEVLVYTDKDGKDTTEFEKMVSYKIADRKAFDEEYSTYMKESLVLDVTNERMETLMNVKNIILNTESTFEKEGAIMYDEWCSIFETI